MVEQQHKPAGDFDDEGKARPAGERQAVKNQGQASPQDYPERDKQTQLPPD
jgi:hypothetical protein